MERKLIPHDHVLYIGFVWYFSDINATRGFHEPAQTCSAAAVYVLRVRRVLAACDGVPASHSYFAFLILHLGGMAAGQRTNGQDTRTVG